MPQVVKKQPVVVEKLPVQPPTQKPRAAKPPIKPIIEKFPVEIEQPYKVETKEVKEEKVVIEIEKAEIEKGIENLEEEKKQAIEAKKKLEEERIII